VKCTLQVSRNRVIGSSSKRSAEWRSGRIGGVAYFRERSLTLSLRNYSVWRTLSAVRASHLRYFPLRPNLPMYAAPPAPCPLNHTDGEWPSHLTVTRFPQMLTIQEEQKPQPNVVRPQAHPITLSGGRECEARSRRNYQTPPLAPSIPRCPSPWTRSAGCQNCLPMLRYKRTAQPSEFHVASFFLAGHGAWVRRAGTCSNLV